MKSKNLRFLFTRLIPALALTLPVTAQAAEYEIHKGTERISGNWASANSDVIIDAGAVITVDGDWYITANNVYIHPSAKILGSGTIHLMNPSAYGIKSAAPTMLDAGGTTIECKVSIENNSTIILTAIDPAVAYASSGITDPGGAGSDNLKLANNLNFNNAGAYVVLGSSSVVFTSADAAMVTRNDLNNAGYTQDPVPGTAADAYLVTTGSGIVRKEGLAALSGTFSYPVGQSAPNDYTPALVSNTAAAARDISVQVKNYSNSGATEGNLTKGIDRTWQITGSTAGPATISLLNNASSEGTGFDHNDAFVTQQLSNGLWSVGTPALPGTPNYTHTAAYTVPAAGATSYFSKSSDVQSSISVRILVSPVALLQGPLNGTVMTTTLNTLGLIPQTQPYNIAPFNYAGTEKVTSIPANVTDWVLVELRSAATPANILATRAGFIKSDGNIVDLDGVSPMAFKGLDAGNYNIAVRHRNHLGIMTATAQALNLEAATTYNFTTAAATASGNNAMVKAGSVYAMWGGNTDYGLQSGKQAVLYSATAPSDVDAARLAVTDASGNMFNSTNFGGSSVSNKYSRFDVNMDGNIRYSASGSLSDVDFIRLNVTNFPTNMFNATNSISLQEQLP